MVYATLSPKTNMAAIGSDQIFCRNVMLRGADLRRGVPSVSNARTPK
jgi:hypothetical protein